MRRFVSVKICRGLKAKKHSGIRQIDLRLCMQNFGMVALLTMHSASELFGSTWSTVFFSKRKQTYGDRKEMFRKQLLLKPGCLHQFREKTGRENWQRKWNLGDELQRKLVWRLQIKQRATHSNAMFMNMRTCRSVNFVRTWTHAPMMRGRRRNQPNRSSAQLAPGYGANSWLNPQPDKNWNCGIRELSRDCLCLAFSLVGKKLIPKTIGNRKRDCAWGCASVAPGLG